MSTRANLVRQGGGIVKVDITHTGPETIRTNLATSLFGSTGEKSTHVVEVREFATDISDPMLSKPDTPRFFFRVFGKNEGVNVRDNQGVFAYDDFHLGERASMVFVEGTNNAAVIRVPEYEFVLNVPENVFCIQDFLWQMQQKCDRINSVLQATGWLDVLGCLPADIPGRLEGGVGTAHYTRIPPIPPILDSDPVDDEKMNEVPLIAFSFTPSGYGGFQCSNIFWNSFGIQLSPYAQQLFDLPELLVRDEDLFGEEHSTFDNDPFGDHAIQWGEELNQSTYTVHSGKSLYSSLEERIAVFASSDIRQPYEQILTNGRHSIRHIFGHFDIAGYRELQSGHTVNYTTNRDKWFLEGGSTVARRILDPPGSFGFASLVLPSIVPSFNVRIHMLRRVWDFEKQSYSEEEVPLLRNALDTATIRLVFTLQQ